MKYLNAFKKISGVGPQKMKLLANFFPDGKSAWKAEFKALEKSGIGEKLAKKIIAEKKFINPDKEWEILQKENIHVISAKNSLYPRMLKEIPSHPYLLYYKGKIQNDTSALGMVGSRKFSQYGYQATQSLAKKLCTAGFTIVSGLALGIDAISHRATLEAGGKTWAVLGGGLDEKSIYPRDNFNLARRIISEGGALISEYPPGFSAGPTTFPARNRIIAGLCLGVLVLEATQKSGALITARMALEYNREVFAVPGSIFSPQSVGTNTLIKNGAKAVLGVSDILEEFSLDSSKEKIPTRPSPENPEEELILKVFNGTPLHIDKITAITKLQPTVVSSTLTIMEIRGWIKNIGGQNYILL